ncbi:MAG: hypothetical protein AAF358_02540 [Pseudomonadota bacterium]
MKCVFSTLILGSMLLTLHPSSLRAQDLAATDEIFRSDIDLLPGTAQGFANAVVMDGDFAMVGASLHFSQEGQVYLLRYEEGPAPNWRFVKTLDRAAEPRNLRRLGARLALDGDWLAVASNNVGTLLYQRNAGGLNNWGFSQQVVLEDSADRRDRDLDNDVSISGNWMAIGAGRTDWIDLGSNDGNDVGQVLLYQLNGADWGLSQVLEIPAPDVQRLAGFGARVSISGDVLVVGLPGYRVADLGEVGRAYIYQNGPTGWMLRRTLERSENVSVARFGIAVAATESVVAVGDLQGGGDETPSVSNDGSILIFERNLGGVDNWGQAINLLPSQPEFISSFGQSIGLVGNLLWAGAQDAGYLFSRSSGLWREVDRNPVPTFPAPSNVREYGFSAALAVRQGGRQILTVAGDITAEDANDVRTGAAFFYGYDDVLFADSFE